MPKFLILVIAVLAVGGGSYAIFQGGTPEASPAVSADVAADQVDHSAHGFALVDGTYTAAAADTSVTWEDGSGAKDLGRLHITSATLVVKEGKVTSADVGFDVGAMASSATGAVQGQAGLSSILAPALAEAKKYPTATFALTGIEAQSAEGEYLVRGTLRLKGDKPLETAVSFPAILGMHDGVLVLDTKAKNGDSALRILVSFKKV